MKNIKRRRRFLDILKIIRRSHTEMFHKKIVLRNLSTMCWTLFLNNGVGWNFS